VTPTYRGFDVSNVDLRTSVSDGWTTGPVRAGRHSWHTVCAHSRRPSSVLSVSSSPTIRPTSYAIRSDESTKHDLLYMGPSL
jgi:hypothetical protein